jgi:hypothetical protein
MGDTFEMQGAGDCGFVIGLHQTYCTRHAREFEGGVLGIADDIISTIYARIVRRGSWSELTAMVEDFRAFGESAHVLDPL